MPTLTAEGRKIVDDIAERHGVSADAVTTLLFALMAGQGSQAQFDHPELGGMGQWSQGGMVMVGDMFNHALKARVDGLCTELAGVLRPSGLFVPAARSSQSQSQGFADQGVSLFVPGSAASGAWWPAELGSPASVGAQNDLRYATFPSARRLAIARGSEVTVYDTADHAIIGFSQQQSGDQSLSFTSQHGLVRLADLAVVGPTARPAPETPTPPAAPPSAPSGDVFASIERLAELRRKDIITEQEFQAKKTELLARL